MLSRIRRIEIRARRLVANVFLGEYHSVFKGRGIEFSEVRQYEPGDDVRMIDWNVTARMGQPYVKQFIEERELTALIVVDVSSSTGFTSTALSKRELAAEVAATLAFAVVANNDRVGMLMFAGEVERYIPPAKSRRHVLRLVRELLYHEPASPGTDIAGALTYLSRIAKRRAIVFFISDFFATGWEQALRAASLRHEIIALTLTDPRDERLPDAGMIEIEDIETRARALIDTSDAGVRATYARRAEQAMAQRRRALAAIGVDEIALRTDRSYVEPLLRAFRERHLRRR